VNLGTSPDGSGTDQPMNTDDPASVAVNFSGGGSRASNTAADVERSIDNSGVDIPNQTTNKNRQQQNSQTDTRKNGNNQASSNKPQQQKPLYVYHGSNGKGGNSASANVAGTSEGNTHGTGDRGVPGGTPGSSNYEGSPGNGTGGISAQLSGRNIIAFPPNEARFREGGKVVVRVTVNRDGEIVNKQIVSSSNTELSPIALKKLNVVRFNKSETAPAEQFGKITFVFKTRQ
ncbi:MAG: energy transducer TonB, partial [Chitinophagaceae bacterium]